MTETARAAAPDAAPPPVTFECAVLDMAGTTVADNGLVGRAFTDALADAGITHDDDRYDGMRRYIAETMGESKIAVFRALLSSEDLAQRANTVFERSYAGQIAAGACQPLPGATETITALRGHGVKVALVTGFSPSTQQAILGSLGWCGLPDLVLAPGDGVRGRPWPDLVLTAALRLQVTDMRNVAVVGDTRFDVITGLRAGAGVSAGVLTGAASAGELRSAGATHILDSIRDLLPVLVSRSK